MRPLDELKCYFPAAGTPPPRPTSGCDQPPDESPEGSRRGNGVGLGRCSNRHHQSTELDSVVPESADSSRVVNDATWPHIQRRNRAGLSPDFPVMPSWAPKRSTVASSALARGQGDEHAAR